MTAQPHLETDIWRWLLFESGLSRRRAREIILQGAQSNALSLFWQAGPAILAQQLGLSPDETSLLAAAQTDWPAISQQFETERQQGLITLRLNQPGYPDTLTRFLPPEHRPLLLFLRGETALLDLPLLLPVADTPPDASASDWALTTLAELSAEGALALFVARAGFEAQAAKAFLDAGIPFMLVIPQGLASYTPPPSLQQALDANRALLISPFQPDWLPQRKRDNALLPHAVSFSRTLAHALLALTPVITKHPAAQPCFRFPGLASDDGPCPETYENAESLFLKLAEAAAPSAPGVSISADAAPAPEPIQAVDPVEILSTLTRGGDIPPALANRLRKLSETDD